MKIKIFLILLSLSLFLPIYAQQLAEKDVVYLRNGEKYSGEIVLKTDKMVMLKMDNGKRFQFDLSDIEKITKEAIKEEKEEIKKEEKKAEPITTLLNTYVGGANIKGGINTSPFAGISLSYGTKNAFKSNTFLGIGIGYEAIWVTKTNENISFVPAFIEVNRSFSSKNTAPAIDLKTGYKFNLKQDYSGGVFFLLSGGLDIKSKFFIGLFIDLQKTYGSVTKTFTIGDFTSQTNTVIYKFGINTSLKF